jgi:hypothetical protein
VARQASSVNTYPWSDPDVTTLGTPAAVVAPQSTTPLARRWFGTGRSIDSDARVAGAQATSAALEGRQASLIVIFCPVSVDIEAMLEGVRAEAGDVPLIGCSGMTQIAGTGPVEPAVVVSALGGEGFEIHTSIATNVAAGQRDAGERVAEAVEKLTREHKLLLMLCDGLSGEQHDIVRGAYGVVGAAVPLAGGCASDDLAHVETFQFYSDAGGVHVISDAVVAAAIGSDAPMGIGVAHGWRRVGEPMVVTSSQGGHVRTLDGEPALDVFLNRKGATRSITDDEVAFRRFALPHPLGMSRRSGEDIRVISGFNLEDGSLTCLADVPQGALLWTMEADQADLIGCVDDAWDQALVPLGGIPPLGFLAFDCIARHEFLGESGISLELDRLVARAGSAPLAGFVTYGEVARVRGSRGMHHLTLVMVAFA